MQISSIKLSLYKKMMKWSCVFIVALIFTSCGEQAKTKQATAVKKPNLSIAKANATATFMVEGMVCKMGCGGSIRKELRAGGFIERVEVNFEEDAKQQEITAYYDSTRIDIVEMKRIIEKANDGQFTVVSSAAKK